MQKVQKTYTTEFKREAVRLAETSGKPITHIARELGISDTSIHQWRKELTEHGSEAFPGSGHHNAQAIARSPQKVNQMHWWLPTCCSGTSAPISPTPNGWPIRPTFGRAIGWLYLAVVLDLFSRMVVGWSMAAIVVCNAGHPSAPY